MESNRAPFAVAVIKRNEEDKFIIVCGKYKAIDKEFDEREQAEAFIKHNLLSPENWSAIGALILAMIETTKKPNFFKNINKTKEK